LIAVRITGLAQARLKNGIKLNTDLRMCDE